MGINRRPILIKVKKARNIFILLFLGVSLNSCLEREPFPETSEPYPNKATIDLHEDKYLKDTMTIISGKRYGNSNLPPKPRTTPTHFKSHNLRWIYPPTGTNYPANYQPTPFELEQWREQQKLH